MPFSFKATEEKPYNRCIDCPHIGVECDGPNFLAMDIRRLCEWARLRKEYLHRQDPKWTNAYVAEISGVSLGTVNNMMAGKVDDLRLSTVAPVIKVLVNGTWGKYPCALAADGDDVALECVRLRERLADEQRKTAYLKEQSDFKDSQLKENDSQIKEKDITIREYYREIKRRSRASVALSFALLAVLLFVIVILIVDATNPNIGFFWLK